MGGVVSPGDQDECRKIIVVVFRKAHNALRELEARLAESEGTSRPIAISFALDCAPWRDGASSMRSMPVATRSVADVVARIFARKAVAA